MKFNAKVKKLIKEAILTNSSVVIPSKSFVAKKFRKYVKHAEIYFIGETKEIDFINMYFRTEQLFKDYFTKSKELTTELKKDFKKNCKGNDITKWIATWIKDKKGWKIGEYVAGNTSDDERLYWFDKDFKYVHFIKSNEEEGLVIVFQNRDNQLDLQVWIGKTGSVDKFFCDNTAFSPEKEYTIYALMFGYGGDYNSFYKKFRYEVFKIAEKLGKLTQEEKEELEELRKELSKTK